MIPHFTKNSQFKAFLQGLESFSVLCEIPRFGEISVLCEMKPKNGVSIEIRELLGFCGSMRIARIFLLYTKNRVP